MADNTEVNTQPAPDPEEEARWLFEMMRIGTPEQRLRIVEQGRKANQVKPARSYRLRLSYSSGSATGER